MLMSVHEISQNNELFHLLLNPGYNSLLTCFLLFQGRFRVNLSGTGFKVAEDISWVSQGNYAVADVQKSQVWTIY